MYKNLIAMQQARGLSDRTMAEVCGLSVATYRRRLAHGQFKWQDAVRLAQLFNAPLEFLFKKEGQA